MAAIPQRSFVAVCALIIICCSNRLYGRMHQTIPLAQMEEEYMCAGQKMQHYWRKLSQAVEVNRWNSRIIKFKAVGGYSNEKPYNLALTFVTAQRALHFNFIVSSYHPGALPKDIKQVVPIVVGNKESVRSCMNFISQTTEMAAFCHFGKEEVKCTKATGHVDNDGEPEDVCRSKFSLNCADEQGKWMRKIEGAGELYLANFNFWWNVSTTPCNWTAEIANKEAHITALVKRSELTPEDEDLINREGRPVRSCVVDLPPATTTTVTPEPTTTTTSSTTTTTAEDTTNTTTSAEQTTETDSTGAETTQTQSTDVSSTEIIESTDTTRVIASTAGAKTTAAGAKTTTGFAECMTKMPFLAVLIAMGLLLVLLIVLLILFCTCRNKGDKSEREVRGAEGDDRPWFSVKDKSHEFGESKKKKKKSRGGDDGDDDNKDDEPDEEKPIVGVDVMTIIENKPDLESNYRAPGGSETQLNVGGEGNKSVAEGVEVPETKEDLDDDKGQPPPAPQGESEYMALDGANVGGLPKSDYFK